MDATCAAAEDAAAPGPASSSSPTKQTGPAAPPAAAANATTHAASDNEAAPASSGPQQQHQQQQAAAGDVGLQSHHTVAGPAAGTAGDAADVQRPTAADGLGGAEQGMGSPLTAHAAPAPASGAAGTTSPSRKRSFAAMAAPVDGEALLLLERMLQQGRAEEQGRPQEADGEAVELEVPTLHSRHVQLYYVPPPGILEPPHVDPGGQPLPHEPAAAGTGPVQGGQTSQNCIWQPLSQSSRGLEAVAAAARPGAKPALAGSVLWPQLLQQPELKHVPFMTAQRVVTHKLHAHSDAAAVAVLGRLFGQQVASLCSNATP